MHLSAGQRGEHTPTSATRHTPTCLKQEDYAARGASRASEEPDALINGAYWRSLDERASQASRRSTASANAAALNAAASAAADIAAAAIAAAATAARNAAIANAAAGGKGRSSVAPLAHVAALFASPHRVDAGAAAQRRASIASLAHIAAAVASPHQIAAGARRAAPFPSPPCVARATAPTDSKGEERQSVSSSARSATALGSSDFVLRALEGAPCLRQRAAHLPPRRAAVDQAGSFHPCSARRLRKWGPPPGTADAAMARTVPRLHGAMPRR